MAHRHLKTAAIFPALPAGFGGDAKARSEKVPQRDRPDTPAPVYGAGGQALSPRDLPDALAPRDGARAVPDRAAFDALSHRDDVPGALGVRELKFVIVGLRGGGLRSTDVPRLYYMNSQTHALHYYFARDVLGLGLDIATFNRLTYFDEGRDIMVGSVILHETYPWADGSLGLYTVEFWPSDVVSARHAIIAHDLVAATMPYAASSLAYHPSGLGQAEQAERETADYAAAGVAVVTSDDIFASVRFAPLNLGHTFGRLRLIDGSAPRRPSATDIAIFTQLPDDLARIAGVVSAAPQTPLSHVNLRAQANDIPNAYLRDAGTHGSIAPHLGRIVRYEVTPDAIQISPARLADLEAFHAARRPATVQLPVRDLSVTAIRALGTIAHADHAAFGAKTANVGELLRLLGADVVPQGFGVPYSFYDRFMQANGLYETAATMMADAGFRADEAVRDDALKRFRKTMKQAEMPADLYDALGAMQARFGEGVTPRCRSSANAEDMAGFSGAGLYDSYTHRADEGHIARSIRQVWASLWTFRAYQEREFWRIDHLACAMGVLVHPNFDDEAANGVTITKNLYYESFPGYYVNVQVGEDRVTNPRAVDGVAAVAEEFLVMENRGLQTIHPFVTIRIRVSNLTGGAAVMRAGEVQQLVDALARIQAHFALLYGARGDSGFAMDVEFKLDSRRRLAIKQARPWGGTA